MSCNTYEYRIVETVETAKNRAAAADIEPHILAKGDIPYAKDQREAEMEAARLIPETYKASQVQVFVRPFVQG